MSATEKKKASRVLGSWELGRTLGEGAFAKVKIGTHVQTQQKAALKIMRKRQFSSRVLREQVEREVKVLTTVDHVNVIKLHEVMWDADYPRRNGSTVKCVVLVLELAGGGELFDYLHHTGRFEEANARTYFQQLVAGVSACHAVGITHRDIKPENLLLDSDYRLKVADFGFAHYNKDTIDLGAHDDPPSQTCGPSVSSSSSSSSGDDNEHSDSSHFSPSRPTISSLGFPIGGMGQPPPPYAAPELFSSNVVDPEAVDVWACGVVLFIMLAGFPPFQRADNPNKDWWFNKLNAGKHALFWKAHCRSVYFSEPVKDLLNKLLAVDPSQRITLTQVVEHEWFKGPTIGSTVLSAEFIARKKCVEDQKVDDIDMADATGFDSDKHRGLPAARPSVLRAHSLEKANSQASVAAALASVDISASQATSKAPVLPADADVKVYTQFHSKMSATALLAHAEAVLETMQQTHTTDEENFFIKAAVATEFATVHISLAVLEDLGTGLRVCQIRRFKGDALLFRQVYSHLYDCFRRVMAHPHSMVSVCGVSSRCTVGYRCHTTGSSQQDVVCAMTVARGGLRSGPKETKTGGASDKTSQHAQEELSGGVDLQHGQWVQVVQHPQSSMLHARCTTAEEMCKRLAALHPASTAVTAKFAIVPLPELAAESSDALPPIPGQSFVVLCERDSAARLALNVHANASTTTASSPCVSLYQVKDGRVLRALTLPDTQGLGQQQVSAAHSVALARCLQLAAHWHALPDSASQQEVLECVHKAVPLGACMAASKPHPAVPFLHAVQLDAPVG